MEECCAGGKRPADHSNLIREAVVSLNGAPHLPSTSNFAMCFVERLFVFANTVFVIEHYRKLPEMYKLF